MIYFITDIQEGETEILKSALKNDLIIMSLDGRRLIEVPAPRNGWTHQALTIQGRQLASITKQGADAFLGEIWVGSTEV